MKGGPMVKKKNDLEICPILIRADLLSHLA